MQAESPAESKIPLIPRDLCGDRVEKVKERVPLEEQFPPETIPVQPSATASEIYLNYGSKFVKGQTNHQTNHQMKERTN
jgi:hypothetical protein